MNEASPGPQHDLEPHVVALRDLLEKGQRLFFKRRQRLAERGGALVDDAAHKAAAQNAVAVENTGTR